MIRTDELVAALYLAGFRYHDIDLLSEFPPVLGVRLKHPECSICIGGEEWTEIQMQVGDGTADDHRSFASIEESIATVRSLLRDEVATKELSEFEKAPLGFHSFSDWVNKAQSRMCPGDICIDSKGRRLNNGADFQRARDEGAFPVDIYRPLQEDE